MNFIERFFRADYFRNHDIYSKCIQPSSAPNSCILLQKGFTLVEVCVASAVLAIGSLSLGAVYQTFNKQRQIEKQAVEAFVCSVAQIEYLIQNPPPCRDTLVWNLELPECASCKAVPLRLQPVPGNLIVAVLEGSRPPFRRLMKCR